MNAGYFAKVHQKVTLLEIVLRLRRIHCLPLVLLMAASPGNVHAGSLAKVWEVDLKKVLQAEHLSHDQSFKVKSLSFSPDAQQIVVLLEGMAILFRVQDPKTVFGTFPSSGNDSFGWSLDSSVIHSGGHVVHLADQKACDLPPNPIAPKFLGKGSLVAFYIDPQPTPYGLIDFRHPGPAHLKLYDADCNEQDSWEVSSGWFIHDASPDRGLLSVWEMIPALPYGHMELIVSPFTKKVVRSRSVAYGPTGSFAEKGSTLCGGNLCWDVDTARQIGQAPVSGGARAVATRASRVVLDDSHYSGIPFSSTFTEIAARRRVWDFRTNKEVVSWQLKFITYWTSLDLDGFNRDRRPIPCAISPEGDYIAEGGDGKIFLYRIQP
jgi:hypothetical protein